MNQLVTIVNDQPVTTSLQVAETFGKEHKNILRDIKLLSDESREVLESSKLSSVDTPMFLEDTYQAEGNFRKYPMYYLNKDGFTILVMGFTGKKATQFKLQYIAQFNKMENELKNKSTLSLPQNYASALRQLADTVEENERLKIELSQKAVIEQTTLQIDETLYTTEEIAEQFGYTGTQGVYKFNQLLWEAKIIFPRRKKRGYTWHLYAKHRNKGLKDLSTLKTSQKWTEKGKRFIEEIYNSLEDAK